ncbi:MAG: sigma-70 family RNA polymerase sigma factor [Planctomycetota bacterium]
MSVSVEELFERWRAGEDRAALAEVFDRTAAEVWRVALHLGGGRAAADDLLQATFLAAMESARGYRRGAPLVPWLLGILANEVRAQRRRARRAPKPEVRGRELDPAAAAVAADLRQRLRAAIELVPQSCRPALVLQLEHGLSAAEIARVLGRRRGTVRSQLSRGIEALRRVLSATVLGGCSAGARLAVRGAAPAVVLRARRWAAPVPRTDQGPPAMGSRAAVASATGVAGVVMLGKKWLFLAVLLLLGAAWWVGGRDRAVPRPAVAGATNSPPPALTAASRPATEHGLRTCVELASADAAVETGSLAVRVVHDDGSAAVGVHLAVRADGGDVRVGTRPGVTDAGGRADFEALPPGTVCVRTDRSLEVSGDRAVIVAGQTADLQLTIPRGLTVSGIVVDFDERPVAAAEVLLAPCAAFGMDAQEVTTTGDDGRFEVRTGYRDGVVVGARAAGFAPSSLALLLGAQGARAPVRLTLPAPGGAVEGRVEDDLGRPVAGAVVRVGVGRLDCLVLSTQSGPALPAQVRAADDGSFRVVGLAPGNHRVFARASGWAPWSGACEVRAGAATPLRVTLAAGCTVRGCVHDEKGAPIARARLQVGQEGDLSCVHGRSGDDGRYVLAGLPSGEVRLRVAHSELGGATTVLAAAAGAVLTCDVTLTHGVVMRGRVVDEAARPIPGVLLIARAGGWAASASSDRDGGFVFTNCPVGELLVLRTHGGTAEDVAVEGIDPMAGEVVVHARGRVLPTGRIVGCVRTPDGLPAASVGVMVRHPQRPNGGMVWTDPASGAFEVEHLAPGSYQVLVLGQTYPDLHLEGVEVREGGTADAGTLRFEDGGTVLVRLAAPIEDLALRIVDAAGHPVTVISPHAFPRRTAPLRPGAYRLLVRGRGRVEQTFQVEVVARAEAVVDVPQ